MAMTDRLCLWRIVGFDGHINAFEPREFCKFIAVSAVALLLITILIIVAEVENRILFVLIVLV